MFSFSAISDHRADFAAALKDCKGREKQVKLAMAKALTFTGERVKAAETAWMQTGFDRPTPYTMRALYLSPAAPSRLQAYVWIKRPLNGRPHYLEPQITGGDRQQKGYERAMSMVGIKGGAMTRDAAWIVPGSAAVLDQHGNISRGQMNKILSAVKRNPFPGAQRTKASAKRMGKKRVDYFIGRPGGGKLPLGIWEVGGGMFAHQTVHPVLIFVRKPRYRKRWPFFQIAKQTADREFPALWARALQREGIGVSG